METNQNYNKNDSTACAQGDWVGFTLKEATVNYASGDIKVSNTVGDYENAFYVAHVDSEINNNKISTFDTNLSEIESTGIIKSDIVLPCGYYFIDSMPTKKETLVRINKSFNEKKFETFIDEKNYKVYVKKEE